MVIKCPFCQNKDRSMIEQLTAWKYLCTVCSKVFEVKE